jgi:uncharacterized membrane protein
VSSFLFTAVIFVFATIGIIVLSALSAIPLPGIIGGLTGFFLVRAIVSLLYCLTTLVQFMGLKVDALDVPDDPAEIERARQARLQAKSSEG